MRRAGARAVCLALAVALFTPATRVTSSVHCDDYNDCTSCRAHGSWYPGSRCFWCGIDNECHADFSPANPCGHEDPQMCGGLPEQLHIAFAGGVAAPGPGTAGILAPPSGMRIGWFTWNATSTTGAPPDASIVFFGTKSGALIQNATSPPGVAPIQYMDDRGYHHVVELTDLQPGSRYYYKVGSDGGGWSPEYSFKTAPAANALAAGGAAGAEGDGSFAIAAFGDMGWADSSQRPMVITAGHDLVRHWSATFSRRLLEQLKDDGALDFVWHLGDIGYLDDAFSHKPLVFSYEKAYNGFMNWMQNLTATLPYMVAAGNHESECHSPNCIGLGYGKHLMNFTAYNARWHMPSRESAGRANMWYSFNYGSVHFVTADTETDFPSAAEANTGDSNDPEFPAGHFGADGEYLRWLEADLAAARQAIDAGRQGSSEGGGLKYIVVGGHRPVTDISDSGHFELFVKYGVSLYLSGHAHSYSRAEAVNGTTFIVSGGAGCEEMAQSDAPNRTAWLRARRPDTSWERQADLTSLLAGGGAGSVPPMKEVAATGRYSMGVLRVNATGLHWTLYDSVNGDVLDQVSIAPS